MTRQRVLLVYPVFPRTIWGMQYALPVLGKKALMPPLGLLTVAAMLPKHWEVRLVDMNCEPLLDADLAWADMVFVSAMIIQRDGLFEVGDRARAMGKRVVFGGPYPTSSTDECTPHCDVVVRGEAEITLPMFLADLERGELQSRYESTDKPSLHATPVPRFDLMRAEHYVSIPIQFSRGCPFQCEFCDIIVLFGRVPRTKTPEQLLAELSALHATGYRGEVFIVDDNFIGNRRDVRQLLPELIAWNRARGEPFHYGTEASVDLARLDDLTNLMVQARFRWVFLGIETPSTEALAETKKGQNLRGSLQDSIDTLLGRGLYVTGGFIIGFDSDGPDIFDRQLEFIGSSGIPFSPVSLLEALPGTALWERLRKEGRLDPGLFDRKLGQMGYSNIRSRLPKRVLLEGYRRVLSELFAPAAIYTRALQAAQRYRRPRSLGDALRAMRDHLRAGGRFFSGVGPTLRFVRSLPREMKRGALRTLWRLLLTRPDQLFTVMDYTVIGYHLHRFAYEEAIPQINAALARLPANEEVIPPARLRIVG